MIFDIEYLKISDYNNYKVIQKNNIICYLRGFIYYSGKRAGKESIDILLDKYIITNKIDLNYFYGAYHIIIIDKSSRQTVFFGDNAGNCCFYYNEKMKLISDSFLELCKATKSITPNYNAITEFLYFNCIYSENTICKEILRTNPRKHYSLIDSTIKAMSKKLFLYDKKIKYENLNQFMKDLLYAADGLKIIDIITGGTDSRTILAHLLSIGAQFDLAISGRDEMIDVQIAKKICEKLNKKLYISDEDINEIDNKLLVDLFIRSDGVYGYFSRYRLHKKILMLEKMGTQLELGGVCGELYKNSFINQDFPFYRIGSVKKEKYYKMKINPLKFPKTILGEKMYLDELDVRENVLNNIFDKDGGEKSQQYFRAGIRVMQYRMVTLSNTNNLSIPSISPFAEIDVMKLTYYENPWNLELNKWQRKEVSKYYPEISDIKTNRNITLINSTNQILKELISSYLFLMRIGLKRLFQITSNQTITKELNIFIKGRRLKEFELSMKKCKELGILSQNCVLDHIPDNLANRLMTIGLVFGRNEILK